MRRLFALVATAAAGCASVGPEQARPQPVAECKAELGRVHAQLAAEVAERQRVTRAGQRREETLRRQIEALTEIERGIVQREERMRTEKR